MFEHRQAAGSILHHGRGRHAAASPAAIHRHDWRAARSVGGAGAALAAPPSAASAAIGSRQRAAERVEGGKGLQQRQAGRRRLLALLAAWLLPLHQRMQAQLAAGVPRQQHRCVGAEAVRTQRADGRSDACEGGEKG
jgi:hypothetical protein